MKKTMFQMIIPKEKKKIANPETILRWCGKCDHRQLMIGMALREKQVIGTNKKKIASVRRVNFRFKIKGPRVKQIAQTLMTVLYPR